MIYHYDIHISWDLILQFGNSNRKLVAAIHSHSLCTWFGGNIRTKEQFHTSSSQWILFQYIKGTAKAYWNSISSNLTFDQGIWESHCCSIWYYIKQCLTASLRLFQTSDLHILARTSLWMGHVQCMECRTKQGCVH